MHTTGDIPIKSAVVPIFNQNQTSFQALLKVVREDNNSLVPFVGAGLSCYGTPEQRLPMWSDLVHKLIDLTDEMGLLEQKEKESFLNLLNEKKLIEALDLLVNNHLKKHHFKVAIREFLDIENKEIPPAIAELVCISWSLIVTTNLDEFIENAWQEKHEKNIKVVTHNDSTQFSEAVTGNATSSTLVKLHGSLDKVESWILTQNQYISLLQHKPEYIDSLRSLYKRRILFLGYGFFDEDFESIVNDLNQLYRNGIGEYFALLPEFLKGREQTKTLISDYNIRPIWYYYDKSAADQPNCGHGQIFDCLKLLTSAWVLGNHPTKLYSEYMPVLDRLFTGRINELSTLDLFIFAGNGSTVTVHGFGGEGKTSFVQYWVSSRHEKISKAGFSSVFMCSFYKADPAQFISSAHYALVSYGKEIEIGGKIRELCQYLSKNKTLLILDGLEIIQAEDGRIIPLPIIEIISASKISGGRAIFTTRVIPDLSSQIINLQSLNKDDVYELMEKWEINEEQIHPKNILISKIGCHALSIRMLAGFLKIHPEMTILDFTNVSILDNIPDESGFLKKNKARRTLDYYWEKLPALYREFLSISSLLRVSISIHLIENTYLGQIDDWQKILDSLIERRLVILESDGTFTSHPLVREYFSFKLSGQESLYHHSEFSEYFSNFIKEYQPEEYTRLSSLVEAAYHSGKSKNWSQFHHIFDIRLNRGVTRYLGDVIGAWEDFLDLALIGQSQEASSKIKINKPSYYYSAAAYALKKLGKLNKAFHQHALAAKIAYDTNDIEEEWARQINNCATVSLSLGRLDIASKCLKLNLLGLHSIADKKKQFWQTEHFLFGLGKFYYYYGEFELSCNTFQKAYDKRDSIVEKMPFHYDFQTIAFAKALSCIDVNANSAMNCINDLIQHAELYKWSDIIATSYATKAALLKRKFLSYGNLEFLDEAISMIKKAREVLLTNPQPEAEIEIAIEEIRIQLTSNALNSELEIGNRLEDLLDLAISISSVIHKIEIECLRCRILNFFGHTNHSLDQLKTVIKMITDHGLLVYLKDPYSDINLIDAYKHDENIELFAPYALDKLTEPVMTDVNIRAQLDYLVDLPSLS